MNKYKLKDIAPIKQGICNLTDKVWLLNLDAVESNTGRIIEYVYASPEEIGNSTITFDTTNVLYCKLRPYLNKVVLPEKAGFATSEMLPLKPDTSVILREYLAYFLRSKSFVEYINSKTAGAKMPRANTKDLKNTEVPCPDLDTQIEIVKQIDACVSIINERNKQIQCMDNLIKARFVELFGNGRDGKCNSVFMGDCCKFQQGTQIPVELQEEEYKEGYKRFLRIIDYTQAPQSPRYVRIEGREIDVKSVVIVRYGATAGFVGRGYSGILANNLFEVVPDESVISKDFLYLALKYGTFERDIHEKAFGAAMPALSFSMMKDIPLVAPALRAQEEFVRFFEQVDKSKVAIQKSLEETQLLFDSLMQEYFG